MSANSYQSTWLTTYQAWKDSVERLKVLNFQALALKSKIDLVRKESGYLKKKMDKLDGAFKRKENNATISKQN